MQIYCEICGNQPARIDPMTSNELNGDKVWGDICCSKCALVICTLTVDDPGIYEFVKVSDL